MSVLQDALQAEEARVMATPSQATGNELRSAILGRKTLKEQSLYVPEWEATVIVREMKAGPRNKLLQEATLSNGTRDLVKFYPMITILSCFDPANPDHPIFELADMGELNEQGGTAMERVCTVAVEVSGLNADALKQAKND